MPSEFILKHKIECTGYKWDVAHPGALVCIVHGIGEHAMRYDAIAKFLNSKNYAVYAFDLPGHGKSPNPRGHIGSRAQVMGLIDSLLSAARSGHPGIPVCIYGHSLGGNLVLKYRLESRDETIFYMITSPWLILASPPPKALLALSKVMAKLMPGMLVNTGLVAGHICSDENVVQAYVKDPLVHGKISAVTGAERLQDSKEIIGKADVPKTPMLLMHGDDDHICSVEGSRLVASKAGDCCTYIEWAGCRHEIHNETIKQDVMNKMAEWLDKRTEKKGP